MTPDAWPRLGLVAACTAYVIGLVVVWQQLGWPAAVAGAIGGGALAVALSAERGPAPPTAPPISAIHTNDLDAELKRRARQGEVPVATRRGRTLAGTGDDDE